MEIKTRIVLWAVLFFNLSASSFAQGQAYRLQPIENDSYRDYTLNEMTTLIGTDARYLPQYQCDGKREFQLITEPVQPATDRNSFRISDAANHIYTYREGKLYTGAQIQVTEFADAFVSKAMKALAKLEQIQASRDLLRQLEVSRYSITLAKGGNRFDPKEEGGRSGWGIYQAQTIVYFTTLRKADDVVPFHQIGNGGIVRWDPDTEFLALESDGVIRSTPVAVALAHELYHSYDSSRGLLDQRHVDGEGYEFQGVLEWRAVYFENLIRKGVGVKYRKKYGTDKKAFEEETGTMLDVTGQPILIPTSCLR